MQHVGDILTKGEGQSPIVQAAAHDVVVAGSSRVSGIGLGVTELPHDVAPP